VLVTCSKWGSAYPTNSHERRGKEVGLPAAVVEAIVAGRPASLTDEREGVVYDVALALAGGRLIPQDLYDRAVKALGHDGVTDMIVLMGYYTCVSLTMNFYAVPASGGGTPRH
jgi:4-carboxymuconolactone decarboxylase